MERYGEPGESRLLLPWRRLPFPAPWAEIFGSSGPLNLEVGFGDARFTVAEARRRPDERFVGLEISASSVQRGLRRVRREGAENVRLVKAGAQFAVRQLFAPHSLASIVVNFPDPWPKERHAGNRLLQERFFRLAASRLRSGGAVLLATDHAEYLDFARAEARRSGVVSLEELEPPAAVFETKYALKWRQQGKPLHYQAFVYLGAPVPDLPPLERPEIMPHALLAGSPPPDARFTKRVLAYGDGHVILHEAARSLTEGERWLVRASVDEPDLHQQLMVVVQRRSGGELIVRLGSFGDPLVTRTARGAVHGVTEWLLELGGVRLLARNY